MLGGLWLRTVLPYQGWPWRLASLFNADVDEAYKASVRQQFLDLSQCCCDEFTWKLRTGVHTEAEFNASLGFLADVFGMAESSNVRTECRFARMKCHGRATSDNHATPGTLFTDHVLSESWNMFQTACTRFRIC